MFILIDKSGGGVYAVNDTSTGSRVVTMFIDKDDATRYHGLLMSNGFKRELEVNEIEPDTVRDNCSQYGYEYTVITPDDLVVPPRE